MAKRKAQVWIAGYSKNKALKVMIFKVLARRGGGWHPVTGGVEKGERYLQGAKRELREETGISATAGRWIALKSRHSFTDSRGHSTHERAFGILLDQIPEKIKLDRREMTAYRWVTPKQAHLALGFSPQQDALTEFLCYLESHESPASTR